MKGGINFCPSPTGRCSLAASWLAAWYGGNVYLTLCSVKHLLMHMYKPCRAFPMRPSSVPAFKQTHNLRVFTTHKPAGTAMTVSELFDVVLTSKVDKRFTLMYATMAEQRWAC